MTGERKKRIHIGLCRFILFLFRWFLLLKESRMKKEMMIVQPSRMRFTWLTFSDLKLHCVQRFYQIASHFNAYRKSERDKKRAHQQKNRNCWIKCTVNLIMELLHRLKSLCAQNQTVHYCKRL